MTTRAIAVAVCAAAALITIPTHAGAADRSQNPVAFQCDAASVSQESCDIAVKRGAPVVVRAQKPNSRPFGGLEVIAGDPEPVVIRPLFPSAQQTPAPAPPPPPPTTSGSGESTASKAD
jgi:hypothetical protein